MRHKPGIPARAASSAFVALTVVAVAAIASSEPKRPPSAKLVASFDGHAGQVYSIAWVPGSGPLSSGGRSAVSGGFDDVARLWKLATDKAANAGATSQTKILGGHDGPVLAVAVDANGRRLITGGLNKTARVWWLRGSPATKTKGDGKTAFLSLTVRPGSDPDGRGLIAVGDQSGLIHFWDFDGNPLGTIETPAAAVLKLAFRPGRNQIVSAGIDKVARLWQVPVKKPVPIPTGAAPSLTAASPDRSRLATASEEGLAIWDTTTPKKLETAFTIPPANKIVALAWGAGDGIAVALDLRTIQVLDAAKGGEPVWTSEPLPGRIDAIALSSDGNQVAVACDDDKIRLVNRDAMKPTSKIVDPPLGKHDGRIVALAYVPVATNRLLSASDDATARLWDLAPDPKMPKNPLKAFDHKKQRVSALAPTPDGRQLITGARDGKVRVFDLGGTTLEPLFVMELGQPVTAVDASKGSATIVSGTSDGKLRLWDGTGKQELERLSGEPEKAIERAWLYPGTANVLSAGAGSGATVWTPAASAVYPGHTDVINGVAFGRGGDWLYTACEDGLIRVFAVDEGKEIQKISSPTIPKTTKNTPVRSVTALKTSTLAAGLGDGRILVVEVDLEKNTRNQPYPPIAAHEPGKSVSAIAATSDGATIVSGSDDQTVKVWNADNGHSVAIYPDQEGKVVALALSADNQWAVVGLDRNAGLVIDLRTPDRSASIRQYFDGHNKPVVGVGAWIDPSSSQTGRTTFVTASGDGRTKFWALDPSGPFGNLQGHEGQVYAVAWSPDSTRVATASAGGWVRIWDLADPSKPVSLIGEDEVAKQPSRTTKAVVYALAFQPKTGNLLAIAGRDSTIRLWNIANVKEPKLVGKAMHDDAVYCLAFDEEGKRLASGSKDQKVRIWDVTSQKPLKVFDPKVPKLSSVYGVAFSPDGRWVAAVEYGEPYDQVLKGASPSLFHGSVLIWENAGDENQEPSQTYLPAGAKALGLAWTAGPGNGFLAVPASDGRVYVYAPPASLAHGP